MLSRDNLGVRTYAGFARIKMLIKSLRNGNVAEASSSAYRHVLEVDVRIYMPSHDNLSLIRWRLLGVI
jgi:hypothetical protein